MNKGRLKKLIYDLDITANDIQKSIKFLKKYMDNSELKNEFSNSLKYKYLSLFIIYEDFISMLLKEYNLYEIGISIDKAIKKLKENNILNEEQGNYLNAARLIRNKIGHRYKQPPIENIIKFLESSENIEREIHQYIKGFLTNQ
ncbi:hypothetical protein OW763_01405 [Clostridium aestuarii]|uniref:DUF86 domain-containing protein n=1 Tax=Clostridium aestuarii TaxID=338193 RepID=A0ABT4CVK9_9CLOT|nr:hypothetical protein [Clostridium aestuarii]MCY6483009.1 hypothetical protein [Clostridium aestuarii]